MQLSMTEYANFIWQLLSSISRQTKRKENMLAILKVFSPLLNKRSLLLAFIECFNKRRRRRYLHMSCILPWLLCVCECMPKTRKKCKISVTRMLSYSFTKKSIYLCWYRLVIFVYAQKRSERISFTLSFISCSCKTHKKPLALHFSI
jgi:hypothetical protein